MGILLTLVFLCKSALDYSGKPPPLCCILSRHTQTHTRSLSACSPLWTPLKQTWQQWQTINILIKCAIRLTLKLIHVYREFVRKLKIVYLRTSVYAFDNKGFSLVQEETFGTVTHSMPISVTPPPLLFTESLDCLHSRSKKKAMCCQTACSSRSE